VALSVDADDATLANIVDALQPDILQLHGKETVARVRDIKQKFSLRVMKAIAVETPADLAGLPGYAAVADRILFDARAPKHATRAGGVDVSSGVESAPGIKDPDMIRAFIRAARATEELMI
jgi:phosphoribosylanthranilate isomerase